MVYQEDQNYETSHLYTTYLFLKMIFTVRKKINIELAIKFSSLMTSASWFPRSDTPSTKN